MENEKCNHKGVHGNFCIQCGMKMWKKCPKCGEQERIDLNVCATDLQKAKDALKKYLEPAEKRYEILLDRCIWVVVIFSVGTLGFLYKRSIAIGWSVGQSWITALILSIMVALVLVTVLTLFVIKLSNKQENELTQDFYKKFSDHAEVLEKAKEVKK